MTAFRTVLLAAAFALGALPVLAAPSGWKPLLEPEGLAAILAAAPEVRVIQVSGDPVEPRIPGSLFSAYADWRGPPQNPGQLPETPALQAVVQSLGIAADTPVVVIHEGSSTTDMGAATRVYWTLKSLGVGDVAVLNGGLAGWKAAGLPLGPGATGVASSDFTPDLSDRWRITTAEIEDLIAGGGAAQLIDARPSGFFEGLIWNVARPGTVRGAASLPFEVWFDGNRMIAPEAAVAIVRENDLGATPLTVSFCNTGHWASINWFVMSELAGIENTRLYAESILEWTRAGGALDNAPHRVSIYWQMTRDWLADVF
jgi:thiosulfate/3-mercaptopyruvate sulfurtransferase